jgi:hypothetical protein
MLIGLVGVKQSGKDTSADYLVEKYNFHKLAFAQPLKDICKTLFNFTEDQLYGSQKEEIDEKWNVTPRVVYQYLGTDVFRNDIQKIMPEIGTNFWIKLTIDNYHKLKNAHHNCNVVISDIRFENELNSIRKEGGIIIKITRPSNKNIDNHDSEKEIINLQADYEIINDGSIQNLHQQIDIIIKDIKPEWV